MGKRIAFDVQAAIPLAWDKLWESNLKQRKKDLAYEKKVGKKPFNWSRTYYLTASDVENQVREFAIAVRDGKSLSEARIAHGTPMAWPPIRISGDLKGVVRKWLLRNSKLVAHNFGKGHISGARFRPRGEPLAEVEVETFKKKEERRRNPKPRPVHFYDKGLLCQKKRLNGRWTWSRGRHQTRSTEDQGSVTCKQCLNLLPNWTPAAPRQGSIDHMPDDNTHN